VAGTVKGETAAISGEPGGRSGESCDHVRWVSLSETVAVLGGETGSHTAVRAIAAGRGHAVPRCDLVRIIAMAITRERSWSCRLPLTLPNAGGVDATASATTGASPLAVADHPSRRSARWALLCPTAAAVVGSLAGACLGRPAAARGLAICSTTVGRKS
jgi:hypothetical protein